MGVMSIGRAIAWLAAQDPDRPAVSDTTGCVTRRELDVRSNRLARAYADLGVTADDLVTIGLPNSVEYFVACAAIWKLGATPQPVSHRMPDRERAAVLAVADPALVVGPAAPGFRHVPAGFTPTADTGPLPPVIAPSWKAPTSGGSTGTPKIIVSAANRLAPTAAPIWSLK